MEGGQLQPPVRAADHLLPLVIIAALLPGSGSTDLALAWTYVALRVVHSVFQATINKIEVCFVLFLVSSLVLLALVARTGLSLLGH